MAATLASQVLVAVFRRNFGNLKRLMIVFWNTCIIYDSGKSCKSAPSDSEHTKSDS